MDLEGRRALSQTLDTPLQQLRERGIAQTAASYGARFVWHHQRPAVEYRALPTQAVRRKFFDGRKPKYGWETGHKEKFGAVYYIPQGEAALRAAIAAADGQLWIANGEPSLWAYHAAGCLNSICWFGEGSIPHTLSADLRVWGVTEVRNPADNDDGGRKSAKGVRSLLKESGIRYLPLEWGENLKKGYDANDSWIDAGFDAARFVERLQNLKALILPSDELPSRRPWPAATSGDRGMKKADAIAEIISRAESRQGRQAKRNGKYANFCCLLHEEREPSAGINVETGTYTCLAGCGSLRLEEVCERLNIDYHPYTPPEPPRGASSSRPREQKPAQQAGQSRADQSAPGTPPLQPHVEPLIGDHVISQRYLTALPNTGAPALAIVSDVGTGKTTLAIQAIRTADTAIYVAHREKLADNFTRAADADGVIVEHYKSLSRADRRRPSKVAFCINSYAALAGDAEGLPTAGLLILDEIAQQLEHIYGDAGTFDGQEAILAAESLKYAIKHAGRVLALDAHLDVVALHYLRAVRGDQAVETVVNTYTADRGALIMHEKRTGALAAGEKLIAEQAGVVVYAFASVERAQTVAADLAQRLGDADAVLLLTADNADGDRQAAFIRDPNGEISKYQAVLYSPVLGTGFDITAPVRAVIGIMGGAHLSAFDARQMIGRCRNTRETHVYLPKRSGSLEENPDTIYQLELDKAQGTRRKLFIDGVIGKEDSAAWQQQLDYLRWHSRVIARRNWSMNHLRDHFVELATGYTVTHTDADDPALYERQKAIKEALDAQRKEMALTVAPVDREAFQRLKEAGRVDQTAAAGHVRWKIETVVGATITPELRDHLWTSSQRSAVRHYTDLLDNVALLKLADAKEDADGVPIPRRSHRTKRRNVVIAVLNQLVGTGGTTVELDRAEFERRLEPVIAKYRGDLIYFGWRGDRIPTETPSIVRGILRAYFGGSGLTLHSQQRTVAGEKVRLYQLDQAALDVLIDLATRRLQMLERRRLEDTETSNLNFAKQAPYKGDGKFKIDRQRSIEAGPPQADPPIWSPDPATFAAVFG